MRLFTFVSFVIWNYSATNAFQPLHLGKSQNNPQSYPIVAQLASTVQATAAVLTSEKTDIPLSSIRGEADRAFRTGMMLEKNGQARAASAAFHEAATLFQCFLDCGEEFQHVSSLPREEIPAMLAYTSVRLAFLSHDALGDAKAAYRLYREAAKIDPNPSAVSFDGMGTALEASFGSLSEAVICYRQAHKMRPNNRVFLFHLAVALERLGEVEESEQLMETLRRSEMRDSCLVDSWGYVRWHTRKHNPINLHRGTRDMLQIALDAAQPLLVKNNLVCEFGVASGRSLRMTQELLPLDIEIHGFDTFTGLPQAWGNEPAGAYSTGGVVPDMEQGKVNFHKGLFKQTIPRFLESQPDEVVLAYANIDCYLYTSTLEILESMYDRVVPGTVLVFDEYLCHSTWRQDEFRAFRECCKRFGWHYEYLAFSLSTKQAVVRITSQLGVGSVSQSQGK
jgi:Macrocin-O-methyltransferase (TylF)